MTMKLCSSSVSGCVDLLRADVVVSHDGNDSIVDMSAFFYVDTTIFSLFKEDQRRGGF